jgi:hypothetical protein
MLLLLICMRLLVILSAERQCFPCAFGLDL